MANPAAGDYYIVPVLSTGKALDVSGNDRNNGANVQIYDRNLTDAQVFRLAYRPDDGSLQITSRFTGKSLDIPGGNLVSGANVQMWTDNDTRAQRWLIAEKSTVTISGKSYKTYEIYLKAATSLCMDVAGAGTSAGTNVWVYTRNNTNAQRWALIPVQPFRSGGVYEIKSVLKTSMNVDIAGGSTANGANCQLYSDNDTNAQKFVILNEGNGWSIRNVASGRYLDVANASFRNGANVQSFQDNDTRAQRWAITAYDDDTTVIGGTACQIVTFGAGNAGSFLMDVDSAIAANGRNVQIWERNQTRAQRFALFPTWAVDPHMPTPNTLGFSPSVAGSPGTAWGPLGSSQAINARFYPAWSCADAWATSGPNAYQWRYRRRSMSSKTSTWGAWGAWTSWLTALVTRSGNKSTVTQGLEVAFALADSKACQIQFEVRATGAGATALLYGATASVTGTFYYRQNVSFGSAAWSPDGIRVACSTDYPYGTTNLYIKSVKWGGRERLSGGELALKQLDDSTSFLIPQSRLSGVPASGQAVTIVFDYGSDQYARWGGATQTRAVTVSYDTTAAETVTFAKGAAQTLEASVNNIGTTRMWVVYGGEIYECPRIASGSRNTFRVCYPFDADYEVVTAGVSGDGERFYVDRKTRRETGRRSHSWMLSDGSVCAVELREGEPLATDAQVDAVYGEHVLNSREWGAVTFAATRAGRFTVEGATVGGVTEFGTADVEAMVGKHAVYRSPAGDICKAAVVSAGRVEHDGWAEVSVSMVREAV